MTEFWKNHAKLRMLLIAAFFVAGVTLAIFGWRMTGQLLGLGIMMLGILMLVAALWVYNMPFETPREKKK